MNPQLSRKRDSGSRNSPKSKRSSITSSPARPSSAKKKKPRKGEAEQEAPLWSLKDPGILDERTVKGVLQYKLNWAGIDPATNKPYQPSWHNADCPTPDVVAQWEEEKRKRARRQNTSEDHASSPIDSAPDSSPIRPSAKRKRQSSSTNETSHAGGPRRKIARVGEIGIGAQSGTSEASASPSQQKEIKDSYEDESNEISLNRGGAPHVEISLNEDFDRTKYSRFPSSSQPTQASSSQQIRTCPEYVTPSRPRFSSSVAPEENIAGGVIPDSQDLPGPSAYEHTGTPSSISGRTARNNTESNTEEGTQEIVTVRPNVRTYTSRIQRASQSSEQQSQFDSEPGGYDKRLRDSDTPSSDFDIPSAQPRPSLDPSISLATQRSSPRRPTSSYSLSGARPSLSQNQSSQPLRPHTTFFELSQTPSSQIQPYRRAKARSVPASSPQFHTQVPLSTGEPSRAASRIDESEVQSSNLLHTSDPRPESQSQSSPGHVVSRLPSFTQTTQGTASTFTQDWKAVEARYPEASTSKGSQKSTNQNGKPSNLGVFKNPKASSNSQADSGTQKSNQRSQGESSHLPSPPFEEVVSSVEAAGSITQASHQGTPSPLPLQQDQLHIESSQATSAHPPDSTMAEAVVENPQQTNHESESRERVTLEAMPSRLDLVQGERETSTMSPPPLPEHVVRNQQAMAANDIAPPRTEFDARPLFQVLPALPFGHVPVGPGPDGFVVDQIFAHQSGYSTASDGSVEVPEEYIVPLPMVSQTRDIYKSVVRNHRHQIACFINDEVFDTSLVNDIDSMVEELQMLCDHQTLHEDDSATQAFEDHTVQAKWAQNISTKCIFLAEFLQAMRDTERTIVILVRPGKMTDILEAILSYHDLVYSRADQVGTFGDPSETSMRITLLPTNMRIETKNPEDLIDLIIAFDSTYTSLPNIDHLKRNPEYPYKRVPVISLVIANSIEHVERSIPESLSVDSMQRKIQTVRYLQQIHDTDVVGMLPEGDFGGPPEAARRVVAFLQNGSDPRAWNLPFLPALEDLEPEETQMEYPPESSNPPQPYAIKRPLDNEDTDSPKRQRLTPSPGEPSAFDQTQMDNHLPLNLTDPDPSIVPLTQANLQTVPALSIVSIPRGDGYAASKAETHILLDRLQALELRLQKKEESEAQLLEENTKLEARCKDYESSIAQINPKYQEALNERGSFEHEATMAQVREGKALKALENKTAAYDKLKSEKSAGDEALAAAKKTFLESTIPGIAETQALEDEIQTLKEKNARLEKTIEREANTLSYIQSSYRDASSAFESAKDDIATLESKLEIANRTANDNIVKIHEINRGNEISELRGVIKGLRNEKAEMERTEERLRESVANAVRRTMRGQSVPHSPRMGTMSPRAQAGVNVQRFQSNSNVGSRGTSPAPGEQSDQGNVMGPRAWSGRSAFGEVLYGSAPPSGQGGNGNGGGERGPLGGPSRFGNHLQ